jgi:hypothetical protein
VIRIAEKNGFGGSIVGQHGEDDGGSRNRVLWRGGDVSVAALERFRLAAIAVPERDGMALLKQQTGEGRTHLAEAEEGEVLLSGHANSWGGAFFLFR